MAATYLLILAWVCGDRDDFREAEFPDTSADRSIEIPVGRQPLRSVERV
jgi:hypothetical protein